MNKKIVFLGVVLLIILAGGWFWLNSKKEVRTKPVATQNETQEKQQVNSSETKMFYDVPELGIKFPVKKEKKDDLIHKYNAYESSQEGSAYFSLKSIVNNGKFCNVDDAPLGALARVNGQYEEGVSGHSCKPSAFLKQFDTFFICYFGPQADDGCFGDLTKTKGLNIRDYIGLDDIEKL